MTRDGANLEKANLMSDPQQNAAPAEGPLTPVYIVWPGDSFSQLWTFLWLGVMFLMSGLLPWGPGAAIMGPDGLPTNSFAPHDPAEPMGLGRAFIVLAATAVLINCAASIWARTYTRGASMSNLAVGLIVWAELVIGRFWENTGALIAEIGAITGGPAQKEAFNTIYVERGPGFHLAVIGAVVWTFLYVLAIFQGSRKLKEKEEARKAASAAASAERAAARKAATPGAATDAKKP